MKIHYVSCVKMNASQIFFVLFCVVYTAFGWFGWTQPSINPSYPNKCWSTDTMRAYNVSDFYEPQGQCVKYVCSESFAFRLIGYSLFCSLNFKTPN